MTSRLLHLAKQQPIALLALFVALGGSSYAAVGRTGSSDDVIHACVGENTGRLRVVDGPKRCGSLETPLSFNREGRRGPEGDRGKAGKAGERGRDGDAGLAGPAGPAGATGQAGATGDPGAAGPAGAPGTDGAQGAAGPQGPAGPAGASGPAGPKGDPGDTGPAGPAGSPDSAATVLSKLQTVDGSGSGLDADTIDGHNFDALFGTDTLTTVNTEGAAELCTIGEIRLTAANFPPPDFMFASGQLLTIAQNTVLFAVLGTNYGGDGTTTFQVPDLRKQAPGGTHYTLCYRGIYPTRS